MLYDLKMTSERLRVTHRFLADEHARMQEGAGLVGQISSNFSQANSTYSTYENTLTKTTRLVKEIKRKEYLDGLKLWASFYAFMGSSAYLFLKRFYLDQIVTFAAYWAYQILLLPLLWLWSQVPTDTDFWDYYAV